jgi:hypothetical protein
LENLTAWGAAKFSKRGKQMFNRDYWDNRIWVTHLQIIAWCVLATVFAGVVLVTHPEFLGIAGLVLFVKLVWEL